ncbi:hydroxyisourate hydrolase [Alistipes sp.]|uniref:hydroxyisourate hydrolase n=1 Tax=Alistipes sp. TaxID=1872444 RepID=UPI003A8B269C
MKRWIRMGMAVLVALLFAGRSVAQEPVCQLSTHMLDVSRGAPAAGVEVELSRQTPDGGWQTVDRRVTDRNGRVTGLLPIREPDANRGIYRLRFETQPYFEAQGLSSIYPYVEVVFRIEGDGHYHIPITMSANGYATYRGN